MKSLSLFLLLLVLTTGFGQSASSLFQEAKELRKEGKKTKAINRFEEALEAAEKQNNLTLQMSCHIELAELKDNVINYKEALAHYKSFSELYKKQMSQKHQELTDSVDVLGTEVDKNLNALQEKELVLHSKNKAIDSLTTEQYQSALSIKDLELSNQAQLLEIQEAENRRNVLIALIGLGVIVLSFFSLGYMRKRSTNKTLRNKNYQIAKEKEKSEELLLNILPKSIATELKEFGKTVPRKYDQATVMFTDFKGFTKMAEKMTPEELVYKIDYYFSEFDRIISEHKIEKIKTIGDAYLCVSGIPEASEGHISSMIDAALAMKKFMSEHENDNEGTRLEMRIGIHTGPLVAGVVGTRKFAYDIWGDTVNIAARMEQSGEPGHVNVSEAVYLSSKDHYKFEFRGEVEAKNKGKLKMYFVDAH